MLGGDYPNARGRTKGTLGARVFTPSVKTKK